MNPERWKQIERLYHAALEREPDARGTFLDQACAGDEELRREVASLLDYDDSSASFIEAPVLELAAQLQAFDSLSPTSNGLTTPESGSPPAPPIFIGDHRILRKLGEGGMGVVYEAEQQHPRRPVALKVIRGGRLVDEYQVKLFQREVRALARLKHPGIAAIYEAGRTGDGQHYFAMELVRGIPLLDYVKGRRFAGRQAPGSVRQRLELFLKICEAISYAHQRGVIHRDLKPANILVADESEGQNLGGSSLSRVEVKVLDFGLARITDENGSGTSGLSQAGQIRGTLPYMSPEQVRGETGQIDVRTDVYALGVILYELLTERLPYDFEHTALPQAIRIICEEAPKPLGRVWGESRDRESRKAEGIDRDIETIVFKALEKESGRRYQSAAAMAEDVTRYLTNRPIRARAPSAFYQFRKLVARHQAPFALLATIFVLLLGFAITMAMQSARIARERDKAVASERTAAEQRDAAERERKAAEQARTAEQEQRLLAETNFKQAEEQRNLAEEQQRRAERQEAAGRRLLYAAQINLAAQDWQTANLVRLSGMLDSHQPRASEDDLRGFEWYYFWRLCHRDRFTLSHPSAVLAVAFSPEGKTLAVGTFDATVRLWDAATGRALAVFAGHAAAVRAVAFSPDGGKLATGGYDHRVKLWEVHSGRELATLMGHTDQVHSVAFSPDGKTLATGSWDGTVKLWDVATARELRTLRGHARWVWAVAFAPDGRRLASAGEDHTVRLWDVASGVLLATLTGHRAAVYAVAFAPGGAQLASGGYDQTVKVWDAATTRELTTLTGHSQDVAAIKFSPDGRRLATGSYDRVVKLWDVATWREVAAYKGHHHRVFALAFAPDGETLATGSEDYLVKVWDVGRKQEPDMLEWNSGEVNAVTFAPDGKTLATAGDSTLQLWDSATGRQLTAFPTSIARSVAYAPDSKRLAATYGADDTIAIWEIATGRPAILKGHTNGVLSAAFSPDGQRLASGGRDHSAKLWDAATGRPLATLQGHTLAVKTVAFSPDGGWLATGSDDGTVKLWDVVTARRVRTLHGDTGHINAVVFSPDGRLLATGGQDRTIRLWDTRAGAQISTLRGHAAVVRSVAFSPDGKRLASGGEDRVVKIWDVVTGQELTALTGHADRINAVAFAPDGKTLATGSRDRTVRLWRAASDREVVARGRLKLK